MTKNPIIEPKACALTVTQDPALGQQLQDLLASASLQVVLKETAHSAVQYLKIESCPQMIILDWQLPENLAARFLREVRAAKRFATVPVLVIVAEPDPQAIKAALEGGANRYLTQSFIQANLARTLRDMRVKTF